MLPEKPRKRKRNVSDDWPTLFILEVGTQRIPFKLVDRREFFSHDGKNGYYVAAVTGDNEVRISGCAAGEELELAIGRAILSLSGDIMGLQGKGAEHAKS